MWRRADTPNDLLDKRGQLIDQLSGYVDVQVIQQKNADTGKPTASQHQCGRLRAGAGRQRQHAAQNHQRGDNVIGLKTAAGDDDSPARRSGVRTYQSHHACERLPVRSGYAGLQPRQRHESTSSVRLRARRPTNNAFFGALASADGAAASISVDSGVEANQTRLPPRPRPRRPAQFAPGNGDNARSLAGLSSAR